MAEESRRRFSRQGNLRKQEARPSLEDEIATAVRILIEKHDATVRKPALAMASLIAAKVASRIAVQTQSVQRALPVVEHRIEDLSKEFVDYVAALALAKFSPDLGRFKAAPVQAPEPAIELAGDWAGAVAGPTVLERHYGISRSSLFRWQNRDEAIGLRTGSKKFVFPVRQFVDGRPAAGLKDVVRVFGDHRLAWRWLITANPILNGDEPIGWLLTGKLEEVLLAAGASPHRSRTPSG